MLQAVPWEEGETSEGSYDDSTLKGDEDYFYLSRYGEGISYSGERVLRSIFGAQGGWDRPSPLEELNYDTDTSLFEDFWIFSPSSFLRREF